MTVSKLLALKTLMLSFVFLTAGCLAAEAPSDMKELQDFAEKYADAWSGGDPVAFAAFYSENGVLKINDGEPSKGRKAIEETAGGFMASFPDMKVRLVELRRNGDKIEFHWHWTGTNTGPGGTGNPVDLRGCEEWTLDSDGFILESLGHMDEEEYERQLNAGRSEDQ